MLAFTEKLVLYMELRVQGGHPAHCPPNAGIGPEILVNLSGAQRRGGPWVLKAFGAFVWRGPGYCLERQRFARSDAMPDMKGTTASLLRC